MLEAAEVVLIDIAQVHQGEVSEIHLSSPALVGLVVSDRGLVQGHMGAEPVHNPYMILAGGALDGEQLVSRTAIVRCHDVLGVDGRIAIHSINGLAGDSGAVLKSPTADEVVAEHTVLSHLEQGIHTHVQLADGLTEGHGDGLVLELTLAAEVQGQGVLLGLPHSGEGGVAFHLVHSVRSHQSAGAVLPALEGVAGLGGSGQLAQSSVEGNFLLGGVNGAAIGIEGDGVGLGLPLGSVGGGCGVPEDGLGSHFLAVLIEPAQEGVAGAGGNRQLTQGCIVGSLHGSGAYGAAVGIKLHGVGLGRPHGVEVLMLGKLPVNAYAVVGNHNFFRSIGPALEGVAGTHRLDGAEGDSLTILHILGVYAGASIQRAAVGIQGQGVGIGCPLGLIGHALRNRGSNLGRPAGKGVAGTGVISSESRRSGSLVRQRNVVYLVGKDRFICGAVGVGDHIAVDHPQLLAVGKIGSGHVGLGPVHLPAGAVLGIVVHITGVDQSIGKLRSGLVLIDDIATKIAGELGFKLIDIGIQVSDGQIHIELAVLGVHLADRVSTSLQTGGSVIVLQLIGVPNPNELLQLLDGCISRSSRCIMAVHRLHHRLCYLPQIGLGIPVQVNYHRVIVIVVGITAKMLVLDVA